MILAKVSGVVLAALAVGAAVWYVSQAPLTAPGQPGIPNSIHSFSSDHPNWRLLNGRRIDTTPLYFDHELHMVHDAKPQMQTRLKTWVESMKKDGVPDGEIPVTRVANLPNREVTEPPLTLACAACHEPDASGEYMKPISFERHCVQCHQLGSNGGEPVPHGSSIGAFIDRMAAKNALAAPAPSAAAKSGPGAKRGPGGSGGASGGGGATTQPVTFANPAAVDAEFAKRVAGSRDKVMSVVKNACTKCHGNVKDVTKIVDPKIPDRWLPRSRFDHKSHAFKSCSSCHEVPGAPDPEHPLSEDDALRIAWPYYTGQEDPDSPASKLAWTHRTRDIMIPGIKSCVECHTPKLAGDSCVMCHTYHGREGK